MDGVGPKLTTICRVPFHLGRLSSQKLTVSSGGGLGKGQEESRRLNFHLALVAAYRWFPKTIDKRTSAAKDQIILLGLRTAERAAKRSRFEKKAALRG
jgi:hypothetical protein